MQTHITVQRPSRGQRIIPQCNKPSLQFFKITDLGTRANGYTTATFLTALSGKDVGDATAPIHNNMILMSSRHTWHERKLCIIKAGKLGEPLLEASGLRKAHKSSSDTKHSKYWTKPVHLL